MELTQAQDIAMTKPRCPKCGRFVKTYMDSPSGWRTCVACGHQWNINGDICQIVKRGVPCGKLPQVGWMFSFPGIPIPICGECWEFYAKAFPETAPEPERRKV